MKITPEGYIELQTTPQGLKEAEDEELLAPTPLYSWNERNAQRKKENKIGGFAVENLICVNFREVKKSRTFGHDLIMSGVTVDSKMKFCTSKPKSDYEVSITDLVQQDAQYYIFSRMTYDKKWVWILGFMSRKEFFERAKFHKKNEYDPSNNFYFNCDCWNLPISSLHKNWEALGGLKNSGTQLHF